MGRGFCCSALGAGRAGRSSVDNVRRSGSADAHGKPGVQGVSVIMSVPGWPS